VVESLGRRDAGRPPQAYRITDAGRAVYRNVAAWVATRRVIDTLLDAKD
jgi:DNA-binding PadR family transcriptional regulator